MPTVSESRYPSAIRSTLSHSSLVSPVLPARLSAFASWNVAPLQRVVSRRGLA
jgi:hypothetical protein